MAIHWQTKKKIGMRAEALKPYAIKSAQPVKSITWFTTPDYLPYKEALNGPLKPFKVGTPWGAGGANEKAYFKLAFEIPKTWKGEKVILRVKSGGEGLCYRPDGSPWQGLDWARNDLLLTPKAKGGEKFALLLEVIPSKTYWAAYDGPVTFEQADIVVEDSPLAQAAFLADLCLQMAEAMDENKLRTERLWQSLDRLLDAFPWGETDHKPFYAPAKKLISRLTELLKLKGEEGRLTLDLMPHSHIDTAWLWPLSETIRKCGRTYSTAINYIEQYPHYRFIQSQPALSKVAKENFPDLYEKMKHYTSKGRWEPMGCMWAEPDTNITGGESLIRQILLGNGFFEREFGLRSKTLWMPDVFGYSAALPQILHRAGVKYFITNKLVVNEHNTFPYEWFHWEGIDGSRIVGHLQKYGYGERFYPRCLVAAEKVYPAPELDFSPFLFGWSDGGGGPTEPEIQAMPYLKDSAGMPKTRLVPTETSFGEADDATLPVWRGELYFEQHRGTYTTQAMTKRLNRECELALRDAEMLASWELLSGGNAHAATYEPLWEKVCLYQFHDILPGSSRKMVYDEVVPDLLKVRDKARSLAEASLARLTKAAKGEVAIANTLSWERVDTVSLPADYAGDLITQDADGAKLALVAAPGLGLTNAQAATPGPLKANKSKLTLENDWVRATFNKKGQLTSLFDKANNREALQAGQVGNELRLHEDRPAPNRWGLHDAWDISMFYEDKYITLQAKKCELVETGPIRATLRFTYQWERGEIVQDATLYAHSRRVDFRTHVDWKEDLRMLRAYFPLTVNNDHATYEIQFGHLRRPNHRSTTWDMTKFEVCAHKWADLSEGDFGLALLNNCKYGHAALGGILSITLLRAPTWPDPTADRHSHDFTYSTLPHGPGLKEVVREAYQLNVPLLAAPGRAPKKELALPVSADNVILETMKPAENGQGVILRLYDALNSRGPARISLPVAASFIETNLMEDDERKLRGTSGSLKFDIKPFEIKTFRVLQK